MDATTDVLAAVQPLVDAGKTLATVASQNKDLLDFGAELEKIGRDLNLAGRSVLATWDVASAAVLHNAARAKRNETAGYRTAIRAAKRAIVELARAIAEMEAQAGQESR